MKTAKLKIPENFAPIKWADVEPGMKVHLNGIANGKPHAFGPHIVSNIERRELFGVRKGRKTAFLHYSEELLIKDKVIHAFIQSVYSGKPGCCCGCLGTHYYTERLRKVASENRGYDIEDHEINERMIKKVVNLMNAKPFLVQDEGNHFFLDLGTRWYIAYKTADYPTEGETNEQQA